ncbi:3-keto-steroid reductase [Mucor velutinosus]|uniref:RNA-directed DNA polymerase n=1 Tax=Mucor velutinosus TaxID=708070 RepID=A0AAN7HYM8_9FUNG|nr:3-keto-steroid reductase [Mucor velutinosus]
MVEAEELNEVYAIKRANPEVPEVLNANNRVAKKKRVSPAGQTVSKEITMKEPRPTRKARVLKVPTKSLNVWNKLSELDSGLSILDWVAIDKDAAKDLVDGLRDLRKQRPKRTKRHLMEMDGGSKEPPNKINVVQHAADSDVSEASSYYDSDPSSDGDSMASFSSGTDSDLNFDDTHSVYRYPYDLAKMKWSSPLKAEISINGRKVIACFDTGGSISVISRSLCESLGMACNGDSLQLVGFNNESAGARADIVMDVPICIQGKHIRPEHMCVQDQTNADLLILGIPWLQAYGVELDIANSIIKVPTTSGLVKLQGFTSHIPGLVHDKSKEIYKIELAKKHAASLEEDLIPDTFEEIKYDKDNIAEGAPEFLHDLLNEFSHVFSEVSGLTKIKGHKMRVQVVEGAKPIKSKCFRLSWEDEDALNKYVDEMLELDLIEEADGTWSSAAFLVGKKDGSRRCVIDYRKVNKLIVQTNFPTPTVAELTELTAGMKYFSCLDASSGYHQLEIDPEDTLARDLTGFVTKRGTFRYKVLPMGISVGGSEFQRAMHSIFKHMIGESACIFYDDVLCFSRTREAHEAHLRELFEAAERANLKFKRKKCHFGQESVEYLGHIISSEGSRPGDRNVEKIKSFPPCQNVSELKSFLGLTGFFRKFTPNYATIAKELVSLTRKGVKFVWGPEQQQAFETLKQIQCSNPVLAFPDRHKVQILSVDGSLSGLGCVLTQVDQFNEHDRSNEQVIGYGSRSLRGSEKNWHIHEVEAFAVVWSIQHFQHYLKGREFILITDHSSLVYIFNPTKQSPKLSRWCAAVMEYNFKILYKPGPSNIADPLSRCIPLPEFIKEFGPARIV